MKINIWFAVCMAVLIVAVLALGRLDAGVNLKDAGGIVNLVVLVFFCAAGTCMAGSVSEEGNWPYWAAAAGGLVALTLVIVSISIGDGFLHAAIVTCLVGVTALVLLCALCNWYRRRHSQEFSPE